MYFLCSFFIYFSYFFNKIFVFLKLLKKSEFFSFLIFKDPISLILSQEKLIKKNKISSFSIKFLKSFFIIKNFYDLNENYKNQEEIARTFLLSFYEKLPHSDLKIKLYSEDKSILDEIFNNNTNHIIVNSSKISYFNNLYLEIEFSNYDSFEKAVNNLSKENFEIDNIKHIKNLILIADLYILFSSIFKIKNKKLEIRKSAIRIIF